MTTISDGLGCRVLQTSLAEVQYLTANLSGGAPSFLYSVLGPVATSSGVVDAVSDRMGNGPDLVATLTARPAWDAVNLLITGDGVNDRLAPTANNAVFDFSTLRTVVTVGVVSAADNAGKRLASVAESLVGARYMEVLGSTGTIRNQTNNVLINTGVNQSASLRAIVTYHNASTTASANTLAHGTVNGTIVALASGSNRLTIFDFFPGSGSNGIGPWRATLGLSFTPTAGDLTTLATWATTYHNAVIAA